MDIVTLFHNDLLKYKNKYDNQTCYIFGSGPSVNLFKIQEDGIFIGCNHIIKNEYIKSKLDYYFFGHGYMEHTSENSECGYGNHKQDVDMLGNHIEKFCMVSRNNDLSVHNFTITDVLNLKNINAIPCDINLENIHKDLESNSFLNHSIVFPAVQFALYCGFTKIYLVGCDCNGYFHSNNFLNNKSYSSNIDNDLLHWWKQIYIFKNNYYPHTKIININPVGLKNRMDMDIYI